MLGWWRKLSGIGQFMLTLSLLGVLAAAVYGLVRHVHGDHVDSKAIFDTVEFFALVVVAILVMDYTRLTDRRLP